MNNMIIFYNIEEFVVKQMFRPYQLSFFDCTLDTLPQAKVKDYEKKLRENPMIIFDRLYADKELFCAVFHRLYLSNFKFYKWLNCPFVDEVNKVIKTIDKTKSAFEAYEILKSF